jgi:Protein of unknown function (DUF3575)
MRKIILLLFLAGLITTIKAQESKWGISVSPALLTTTEIHYGLQAGVEYKINSRLSILTDLAVPITTAKDSSAANTRYLRIKPEIRYLLSRGRSAFQSYAGFQVSYSFRKWKNIDGGSYFDKAFYEDSCTFYSSAVINSPVITSSLQLGAQIKIFDRFYIDLFMGMGVRMVNTGYTEVENMSKKYSLPPKCKIMISPDPAYWVNGTIARFHSNMGLRFMYRF